MPLHRRASRPSRRPRSAWLAPVEPSLLGWRFVDVVSATPVAFRSGASHHDRDAIIRDPCEKFGLDGPKLAGTGLVSGFLGKHPTQWSSR